MPAIEVLAAICFASSSLTTRDLTFAARVSGVRPAWTRCQRRPRTSLTESRGRSRGEAQGSIGGGSVGGGLGEGIARVLGSELADRVRILRSKAFEHGVVAGVEEVDLGEERPLEGIAPSTYSLSAMYERGPLSLGATADHTDG